MAPLPAIALAIAAVGTGISIYEGVQANKAQQSGQPHAKARSAFFDWVFQSCQTCKANQPEQPNDRGQLIQNLIHAASPKIFILADIWLARRPRRCCLNLARKAVEQGFFAITAGKHDADW